MKKYSKEDFMFAAELGEVSLIDAAHVCSLLDEAVSMRSNYDCLDCENRQHNIRVGAYCILGYKLHDGDLDCSGEYFLLKKQKQQQGHENK